MTLEDLKNMDYETEKKEGRLTVKRSRCDFTVYYDGEYVGSDVFYNKVLDIITNVEKKAVGARLRDKIAKDFIVLRFGSHAVLIRDFEVNAGGDAIRDGDNGDRLIERVLTSEELSKWCNNNNCTEEELFA